MPEPDSVFIAVGTCATGGWYVEDTRFGCRLFPDKGAAWAAIRGLMSREKVGRWAQVPKLEDVIDATHPGSHHPRSVVDAAVVGYKAAYHDRAAAVEEEGQDCCYMFGLNRAREAARRNRMAGAELGLRIAEFSVTSKVRHPAFHDPVVVVEGVADGYRAGWSGEPPDMLPSPNCCYAFGFWESVSVGEEDHVRSEARWIHAETPSISIAAAEKKLRWTLYRRKHPY